jgi:hypothetical protein
VSQGSTLASPLTSVDTVGSEPTPVAPPPSAPRAKQPPAPAPAPSPAPGPAPQPRGRGGRGGGRESFSFAQGGSGDAGPGGPAAPSLGPAAGRGGVPADLEGAGSMGPASPSSFGRMPTLAMGLSGAVSLEGAGSGALPTLGEGEAEGSGDTAGPRRRGAPGGAGGEELPPSPFLMGVPEPAEPDGGSIDSLASGVAAPPALPGAGSAPGAFAAAPQPGGRGGSRVQFAPPGAQQPAGPPPWPLPPQRPSLRTPSAPASAFRRGLSFLSSGLIGGGASGATAAPARGAGSIASAGSLQLGPLRARSASGRDAPVDEALFGFDDASSEVEGEDEDPSDGAAAGAGGGRGPSELGSVVGQFSMVGAPPGTAGLAGGGGGSEGADAGSSGAAQHPRVRALRGPAGGGGPGGGAAGAASQGSAQAPAATAAAAKRSRRASRDHSGSLPGAPQPAAGMYGLVAALKGEEDGDLADNVARVSSQPRLPAAAQQRARAAAADAAAAAGQPLDARDASPAGSMPGTPTQRPAPGHPGSPARRGRSASSAGGRGGGGGALDLQLLTGGLPLEALTRMQMSYRQSKNNSFMLQALSSRALQQTPLRMLVGLQVRRAHARGGCLHPLRPGDPPLFQPTHPPTHQPTHPPAHPPT